MFSKKYRITALEVQKMFSGDAETLHSELFLVKKSKNNLERSRFAVIIPKKVSKLAVKRHLDKRRIIRLMESLNFPAGNDYVLNLKKDIKEVSNDEIKNNLVKVLI